MASTQWRESATFRPVFVGDSARRRGVAITEPSERWDPLRSFHMEVEPVSKSPLVFLVVASLLCLNMTAWGSDGWKMPNLNPFPSKPARSPARPAQKSSWWSPPKMPGFLSTPPRRPGPSQPSMFSKMTQGTKSAMSKTYDVLTPWDNKKPKKPATQISSGGNSSNSQGGFFGWFTPKEEPRTPTVNEWLNQPRP
jgi:hypothetical protein